MGKWQNNNGRLTMGNRQRVTGDGQQATGNWWQATSGQYLGHYRNNRSNTHLRWRELPQHTGYGGQQGVGGFERLGTGRPAFCDQSAFTIEPLDVCIYSYGNGWECETKNGSNEEDAQEFSKECKKGELQQIWANIPEVLNKTINQDVWVLIDTWGIWVCGSRYQVGLTINVVSC